MAIRKTDLFLAAKQVIRRHPDWTDDQVAEEVGIKKVELDLVRTARRDVEAG